MKATPVLLTSEVEYEAGNYILFCEHGDDLWTCPAAWSKHTKHLRRIQLFSR